MPIIAVAATAADTTPDLGLCVGCGEALPEAEAEYDYCDACADLDADRLHSSTGGSCDCSLCSGDWAIGDPFLTGTAEDAVL